LPRRVEKWIRIIQGYSTPTGARNRREKTNPQIIFNTPRSSIKTGSTPGPKHAAKDGQQQQKHNFCYREVVKKKIRQ